MIVALSVLLSFATPARALDIPVKDGDQILLRGPAAQVHYTVVPGATVLKISELGPIGWEWERREQVLAIDGPEAGSRSEAASALRTAPARSVIDIQGPSLPIEIHLRDGSVTLTRGSHEARVNLQSGRVQSSARAGGLRVTGRKVDLAASDSTGRVDVDVYSGNVTLRNQQGDSNVELFSGALIADSGKGAMTVVTHSATGKVQKFSGTLQLDLGKGAFTATGVAGRVEGKTQEGNIALTISKDTDVNLNSQSGRVQINLPASSGASLNLVTSGDIFVPRELRVVRGATQKVVRGKLRGEGSGQLIVRALDGNVVVK